MKSSRRAILKQASLVGGASAIWPSASVLGYQATSENLPEIPYGAVYFRKTAPPSDDWERDYRRAAADGMNTFRHWFMWSAIEIAPGQYDWNDYDRQFDLAAKHGMKTIVAEILSTAPQWAFARYPHARMEAANGRKVGPHYNNAAAVGGWPGLCLDNDEVLEVAEQFIRQLVRRYRQHPAMEGYDVWNELNHLADAGGCWCIASAEKFRLWLKTKYGDVKSLGEAWYRYSYTDWSEVQIPRTIGPYPDAIDWSLFRIDNAMRIFERRVKLIRELDPDHPVTNHTIPLRSIEKVIPATYPDGGSYPVFQATKLVDVSGFSGGGNHDDRYLLRWGHWAKMDITRSAARGKPFWAAEMTVGNSWGMASLKVVDEGRVTTGDDVRFFTLMNLAGGVRGFFSPRWRPLLDGKTVGNFAFYAMDGSATERSEAAEEIIQWIEQEDHASLLAAKPVNSDVGILVVPESQIHDYCRYGNVDRYEDSVVGAYQGFLFNNLQVDFVPAGDIPDHLRVLYLPYPVMLPDVVADRLREWVRAGGYLISEGCPGYFGDRGRAGTTQPNLRLDELFGAKQSYVQFTPDLLDDLVVVLEDGTEVDGGISLQVYEPTTGTAFAKYQDGRVAGIENRFGKGKTRLLGTFPGSRLRRHGLDRNRRYFADSFAWTGREQHVTSSDPRLIARLQSNSDDDRDYMWIVNSARQPITGTFRLSSENKPSKRLRIVRGGETRLLDERTLEASLPARDVTVVELKR